MKITTTAKRLDCPKFYSSNWYNARQLESIWIALSIIAAAAGVNLIHNVDYLGAGA